MGLSEENSEYLLTIDDDPRITRFIEAVMGLKSFHFVDEKGLKSWEKKLNPAGIFVDINLEDGQCGLDLIPRLRALWPLAPIIVMTGDSAEKYVGEALASGADDFVIKPLNPAELLARYKARANQRKIIQGGRLVRFGDLELDTGYRTLKSPQGVENLAIKEAEILACLMRAPSVLVGKDELKRLVWGGVNVSDNSVDRKVFELRKSIKRLSRQVELHSVYGKGLCVRSHSFDQQQLMVEDQKIMITMQQDPQKKSETSAAR